MTKEFEPADDTNEAMAPLIALWGPSGCGKTLSALYMARGIVGPNGKIAVIDTENRRALHYNRERYPEIGGFRHIDFQPNFTGERYMEALRAAENDGAQCIVIDSTSHVWEGEGGTLEQAEEIRSRYDNDPGMMVWKKAKAGVKLMINRSLRSPVPIIFCLRAKEKMQITEVVKDGKKKKEITEGPLTPIMEKRFVYDMTISLQMTQNGFFTEPNPPLTKIPGDMRRVLRNDKPISMETGAQIMEILRGGDNGVRELRAKLQIDGGDAAEGGLPIMMNWWNDLTAQEKQLVGPYKDGTLKPRAMKVDEEAGNAEPLTARTPYDAGSYKQPDPIEELLTPTTQE